MMSARWRQIHRDLWVDLSRIIAVTTTYESPKGQIVTLHMDNGTKHRIIAVHYHEHMTVGRTDKMLREWLKTTLGLDREGTPES